MVGSVLPMRGKGLMSFRTLSKVGIKCSFIYTFLSSPFCRKLTYAPIAGGVGWTAWGWLFHFYHLPIYIYLILLQRHTPYLLTYNCKNQPHSPPQRAFAVIKVRTIHIVRTSFLYRLVSPNFIRCLSYYVFEIPISETVSPD